MAEDNRKISVCIPTWERFELLIDSFIHVLYDDRISEIIIVDDASSIEIYNQVKGFVSGIKKVKLFRNLVNQDCYRNKKISIEHASNERCILLDSDNVISSDYIDKIYSIESWNADTIYTPSFASPNFDFRSYEGILITKENVSAYIDKPMFEVCLNAANYFVDVYNYLEVWDAVTDPVTSDSIFQCYNWLLEGKSICIVPGLTYHHRVHSGSHYQTQNHRTPNGFHEEVLQKLRELK